MPARLVAVDSGTVVLVDKPILLIGRHPECDVQIDSRKISRRHCCIAIVSDYLVIRDLGSTNGIRINGVRQVEGKLVEGDQVSIGHNHYRVTWATSDSESPSPSPARLAPAAGINPVEDDLLEECDEPVALEERGMPAPKPVPPKKATKLKPDPSHILPDVLELAKSDVFPEMTPPSSGSTPK